MSWIDAQRVFKRKQKIHMIEGDAPHDTMTQSFVDRSGDSVAGIVNSCDTDTIQLSNCAQNQTGGPLRESHGQLFLWTDRRTTAWCDEATMNKLSQTMRKIGRNEDFKRNLITGQHRGVGISYLVHRARDLLEVGHRASWTRHGSFDNDQWSDLREEGGPGAPKNLLGGRRYVSSCEAEDAESPSNKKRQMCHYHQYCQRHRLLGKSLKKDKE